MAGVKMLAIKERFKNLNKIYKANSIKWFAK